jgi:hypothetical protein
MPYSEKWNSQVEVIRLRKSLPLKIRKNATGYTIFCKPYEVVGDGDTLERAMQMLFDHLMLDYYEYSLNPGPQCQDDCAHGRKLKLLFNTEKEVKNLLDTKRDL